MRSQLKAKYNNAKQEADRNAYKKQWNLCVKLRWKAVKQYFVNKCQSGITSNKNFSKTAKPSISNKTSRVKSDIILIENNNIIKDSENVANTLNEYFINISIKHMRNKIQNKIQPSLLKDNFNWYQAINLGVKCWKTYRNWYDSTENYKLRF